MNISSSSLPSDNISNQSDHYFSTAMIRDFPYPILCRDLKNKILWVNSSFCNVTGFSLDQLIGLSDLPVIAESGEGVLVCIRNKKPAHGVLTLRFPAGNFIWEENSFPVFDEMGNVTRTVSTYKDITSERHFQAEYEKLRRRLEVVVQQNPMPIALVNLKFKILIVNEAFCRMCGISRDKLLTMSIKDFTLLDQSGEGLKEVIRQNKRSFGEVRVDFSGNVRLLQQYGIPIPNERDELTNILIVYNDVTEERRERVKIEQLQRRSETIVQQNPMPMLLVNPSFKILVSNTAFHDLSQLSGKQLSSMTLKDFRIIDQTGEGLKTVIEHKKRSKGEVEVEFSHGTRLLEQYGIPILNSEGVLTNILIVYNDVTEERRERVKIEQLQRRSETIVQQNPMPMLLVNPSFKILVSNTAFHDLSQLSGKQLSSMTLKDFRIIDQTGEGLKTVIEHKKRSKGEVEVEFSYGTRLLEQYGIPIENLDGVLTNILIVYNDITQQRNLLNSIKNQAEALKTSTEEVGRTLSALSLGNFTTLAEIFQEDPLRQLKLDLNSTISTLHDILKDIVLSYQQIEGAINDVAMGTNDIAKSSGEVASITVNTSADLSMQVEKLEFASSKITDISASIEEIASNALSVKELASNVGEEGDAAVILGNQAGAKMKIVEQISMHAVEEITDLNNRMQEIRKIVRVITDIANQTNLLALNAAIEAARAGEAGRGFAVVAGEVKNLAAESKNASNNIQESIAGIITRSEKTSDAMKQAYDEIISGIDSVHQTTNAIAEMVRDVKATSENISEVTRATEDQAVATNNITGEISNTMDILQTDVLNMDNLAALTEESSAATEEIAARASEIQQMAVHFQKTMKKFTL